MSMEPVSEVLAGKRLVLTGATGLMGIYTAAKLLTDVPKLAGLVIPVRGEQDSASTRAQGSHAERLG